MSSFKLNKAIFTPDLYKRVQQVWFEGVSLSSPEITMDAAKRWFMLKDAERDAFDSICRNQFATALESIGPDQFPNPSGEPFVSEVREAAERNPDDGGAEAAWMALSIVLLLDQMPRNIYRTNDGLRKVYGHYDRIAFSFVNTILSSESPIPRPDLHPQWRTSVAYRHWFYLPWTHSEDLAAHKRVDEVLQGLKEDLSKEEGNKGRLRSLQMGINAADEHREIIERFGRYPHRNLALGRESTQEEKEFLAGGGATFGVSQE